jgi:hypothetical protein
MAATSPEAETIIRQTAEINRLMDQSASRIERIQRQLDSTYAAQTRFTQAQTSITSALERGRISQERANELLDLARQKYQGAGAAAQAFQVANDNAARGTRNFGGVIGQAGFQLQDFFVQVQGGTSALTALSQQGSQFLGVFGTGGAIAGAVLAVGALVAGLVLGRSAADRFKEAMDEVGRTYERNTAHAERWRRGLEEERNRTLDLTAAYESMNQAAREYERRRLLTDETRLRTTGRDLDRDTDRELQDVRRTLQRQIAAAREQTLRNRQFDANAPTVTVSPDLQIASQALAALSEPGSRTVDQIRELSRQLSEASLNAGPFAELMRDTSTALDALVPRWAEYSQAVQRNQRDLAANEEAARRNGQATTEMGGAHGAAAAEVDRVTQALARQIALYNQATEAAGTENRLALQRAQERAAAIARGPEAAALFDAEQRRRDSAQQYYDEQTRRDRARLSEARATEEQIRTFLDQTEAERRRVANDRARQESQNDTALERARQAERAARAGASAARREERLDERSLRERNQLLSAIDEEARANIRLEEALKRIAEARRRNQLSEEEATRYSQMARDRRQQEIVRSLDKSELDAEEIKRISGLTSDLGQVFRDTFQDAVRDGKSFADVLKNIEQRLLKLGDKYLLEPLLQQIAQLATSQLGGSGKGGAGGIGGLLGQFLGGGYTAQLGGDGVAKGAELIATAAVAHTGGVIGESALPTRPVPASVFLDAPRYHSGGFAGGMPFANDEVPAVLRRGELVLTKEQQRASAGNRMTVNNYISTPSTAEFRRSGGQISADLARAVARGGRNR